MAFDFDDHFGAFDDPPDPSAGDDDWAVVSVVDARGSGADVAFTSGLNAFGRPELVLWARPTEGDDPGADWLLTHDDRFAALDEWACDLIDGLIEPGHSQSRTYDGGQAVARFRFGPVIPAGEAGPLDLPARHPVMVVGWSLARRTRAALVDPASPGVRRVQRWISRAETIAANWRRLQGLPADLRSALPADRPGGRAAAIPAGPASRFGPMSEWVQARAGQLLAAGDRVLTDYVGRVSLAAHARCEGCLHDRLVALALRHGRGGAAREARNTAELVAMRLTDTCAPSLSEVFVREPVRMAVQQNLESLLLAAVTADVAPTPLMASACGAWEWAVHRGRAPGRPWLAPTAARRAAQQLFTGTDGSNLLIPAALSGWPRVPDPDLDDAGRTAALIAGLQTVAAGSARPGWLLSAGQRRQLSRSQVAAVEALAAPVLTAIALPALLPPDAWPVLTRPLRPFVPDLPTGPPGERMLH